MINVDSIVCNIQKNCTEMEIHACDVSLMNIIISEIFANSFKRHCHIKTLRLGHDLPTSIKDSDFKRVLFS